MLQYRGKNAISKFQLENPARHGESRCSISGCCDGVDLECFGCHPGLLYIQGIPCEQQTTETNATQGRDCFCDTSCIIFDDCCDDHFLACAGTYLSSVSMLNREIDTKLSIIKLNYFNHFRYQRLVYDQNINLVSIQNYHAN